MEGKGKEGGEEREAEKGGGWGERGNSYSSEDDRNESRCYEFFFNVGDQNNLE